MWDPNASIQEKKKMEQQMKKKIQETFSLFVQDKKGYVDKKEIPFIMPFQGKFPSEAQVSKTVLPQIEEDEPNQSIQYSKFEPFMIQVLKAMNMIQMTQTHYQQHLNNQIKKKMVTPKLIYQNKNQLAWCTNLISYCIELVYTI